MKSRNSIDLHFHFLGFSFVGNVYGRRGTALLFFYFFGI